MKKKKAQFYIIAAVVIAIVLAGLIAVLNYAIIRPAPVKFYDLSEQLEGEATKIIDYGVMSGKTSAAIEADLDAFMQDYIEYLESKEPNIELVYVYGNEEEAVIVNYAREEAEIVGHEIRVIGGLSETESRVTISIGDQPIEKRIIQKQKEFGFFETVFNPGKKITIRIYESESEYQDYEFLLYGEQQFFAIIKLEKEGEVHVETT